MMYRITALCCLALLSACAGDAEGTFVGNPSLTAGFDDNETQRARGGQLVVLEGNLLGCDGGPDVALGPVTFAFVGSDSVGSVQLPEGPFCGLFLVVQEFRLSFDTGGAELTTVVAQDFDLVVSDRIEAMQGERYALRLGNEGWLAALAQNTQPGENSADSDHADLRDAFVDGLNEGSAMEELSESEPESLPGRLNLEGYPTSPLGTPSQETGCGDGVELDLAVPIPHAAMASLGTEDGQVGWCEGPVLFSGTLAVSTSVQLDYSDLSTYTVDYNGWGQGCDSLHCNGVYSSTGESMDTACTVLAFCDVQGNATVTGYSW